MEPSFIELVKDITLIDITERARELCYDENDGLDSFSIPEFLPDARLIAEKTDHNIVYQGTDCSAKVIKLYKYRSKYIVYRYDTKGDDTEVLSIMDNFKEYTEPKKVMRKRLTSTSNKKVNVYTQKEYDEYDFGLVFKVFLEKSITIIDEKQFNCQQFLDKYSDNNLDFIIQVYSKLFPVNGQDYVIEYVKNIYIKKTMKNITIRKKKPKYCSNINIS